MKSQEWYAKEGEVLTGAIKGRVVVECGVFPQMMKLFFGDGSFLSLFLEGLPNWGMVLPAEKSVHTEEVKDQKQRLEDGIRLLISNFVERTGIVVDNVCVQRKQPWGKEERYIVDVNVK